ncbi:MAG TPA: serine/threonine protein kinase, partial [Balneolaceae bacterium]|nr:serine/threonine protein kinase [Balneolaceae bacterium]
MEQEILANLNHPNIATLFDGGFTEEGFPYLIMEYVQGLPIDEFCQKHQLSVSERLALFKKVLAAIKHAHSNLIIHRDLKPSNILIDEEQNLKVLDFGIAKTLSIKEDQDPELTQSGERVWTPSYAAPEQILERPSRIQTDIYGLGALLY